MLACPHTSHPPLARPHPKPHPAADQDVSLDTEASPFKLQLQHILDIGQRRKREAGFSSEDDAASDTDEASDSNEAPEGDFDNDTGEANGNGTSHTHSNGFHNILAPADANVEAGAPFSDLAKDLVTAAMASALEHVASHSDDASAALAETLASDPNNIEHLAGAILETSDKVIRAKMRKHLQSMSQDDACALIVELCLVCGCFTKHDIAVSPGKISAFSTPTSPSHSPPDSCLQILMGRDTKKISEAKFFVVFGVALSEYDKQALRVRMLQIAPQPSAHLGQPQ